MNDEYEPLYTDLCDAAARVLYEIPDEDELKQNVVVATCNRPPGCRRA